MSEWYLFSGLAAGAVWLASRALLGRRQQAAAAHASGLAPVRDLSHVPVALQRTALWTLSDGGFESRIVHGVVDRGAETVDVTAFDLETLRERRGEWAYLPVDPPFRIAGRVSVVVCELDRTFPHYLLKRTGRGDAMQDDSTIEIGGHVAKAARRGLGLARSYAAEMPPTLPGVPLDVELPDDWRAYGTAAAPLATLLGGGLGAALVHAGRRDLVIELIDNLVIVYPAARDVVGPDAFADLTSTALAVVDGILASSPRMSPRGMEAHAADA